MDRYVHFIYVSRALARVGEGAWLKLTAAHGCYWKKCTFCDISLPYIADYDPMPARTLADHMDLLHQQTGLSGFHFTDEAAPPALLVNLSLELLRRKRDYFWWGNVRYDRAFDADRCRLLAAAGMVRVTGGIETASDKLLQKMVKGVSVEQLVGVLQAFAGAGIGTHGYLIYGFPGETMQDTTNGLEILRQLMRAGILQSGYYHELGVSAHAPLGLDPERFQIRIQEPPFGGFARNRLPFTYQDGQPRSQAVSDALTAAMSSYTRGRHLDRPVVEWFGDEPMPPPTVPPHFVASLMDRPSKGKGRRSRVCWLGGEPTWSRGFLRFRSASGEMISGAAPQSMADDLRRCHPTGWTDGRPPSPDAFESSEWFERFRRHGLVMV
jgi:hypothetical protein